MKILTTTDGQTGLPRYFGAVFDAAAGLENGWLDMVLPDGRRFRAEGRNSGPVAEFTVHGPDLFARLLREGDLGFCEAYIEDGWPSPDLQAFMDLVHAGNDALYDGFPGQRADPRLRELPPLAQAQHEDPGKAQHHRALRPRQ